VLALGCDMPLVPAAALALLLERARSGALAVAPASDPGGRAPLCVWCSVIALDAVTARLSGPDRSVRGLLRALGAVRVDREALARVCDPDVAFRGANTPGELAELERLAAGTRSFPPRPAEPLVLPGAR